MKVEFIAEQNRQIIPNVKGHNEDIPTLLELECELTKLSVK